MGLARKITFSAEERARLAKVCVALGTRFEEFVHDATMQALDEMEGPDGPQLAEDRGWAHG
jgi:hypothetical protein